MIIPAFLSKGDSIGIASSARFISSQELKFGLDFIDSLDMNVVLGKNLFKRDNQFAGTDNERIADIQSMLDDPEIKAILFARGGYGSVRIIDQLDFTTFTKKPKWLIGYSDVTVFHNHLNQVLEIPTIQASMPISFPTNTKDSMIALGETLMGERTRYRLPAKVIRKGKTKAQIVGGNLSIIYSLMGSQSQLNTRNKILFIEDIDEMLYHIDRMMIALKRAGMLSQLAGLIVGGMTNMRDNTKKFGFNTNNPYGKTSEEIIWEHVQEFDYPVCFDYPAGHQDDNFPLVMGMELEVGFKDDWVDVSFL